MINYVRRYWIKIIALDIYGTILATEDPENLLKPRKGLEKFFDKCKAKGIKVVASSDADTTNIKIDLKESGANVAKFDRFYELKQAPKDFSVIIKDYGINPKELLVVGDSDKDIEGAINCKAGHFRVPEYKNLEDNFDLSGIEL